MSDWLSQQLLGRIPELSYLIASALMIFASDFAAGTFLNRWLKKMTFLTRTLMFLVYGLFALPGLTALAARLLRTALLEPYKEWLPLILLGFFLLFGVFLSIRYNTRMRLRIG